MFIPRNIGPKKICTRHKKCLNSRLTMLSVLIFLVSACVWILTEMYVLPQVAMNSQKSDVSRVYKIHYSRFTLETRLLLNITAGVDIVQKIIFYGIKESPNFLAKIVHGNIRRGLINMHVNIRSLYNKLGEVKNLVKKEKPHIFGISEAELVRSHHDEKALKIPGYSLILPRSWSVMGKARVVIYVKSTLDYEHLIDLEDLKTQTIWIRAGFKNTKKIYFSHQYREHTCTLGNSIAAQVDTLELMLLQWEKALFYGGQPNQNEVHIMGDFNLDSLNGRWLQSGYSLKKLAKIVQDCCYDNNITQMVNKITRIQYDSVKNKLITSCIDHVYCNMKLRISEVRTIPFGASDHDAIIYTRYARESRPPRKTIRKRSYKNFVETEYIRDIQMIDFTDVYECRDVDDAALKLTEKILEVLNFHAPWVIYQERKHFSPWIKQDTLDIMKERDKVKHELKNFTISADRQEAL